MTEQPCARYISYLRVSTKTQEDSGLGLEAQKASVARFLNGNVLVQEIVEIESGKKSDRPKLAEALRLCRVYNCCLLVAKLDRLARNVHFISSLMESGVRFTAVDMPQANDMTIHILAAVAQGEAKATSDRTRVALAAAKARGTVLGGQRWNSADIHTKGTQASVKVRKAKASNRTADLSQVIESIKGEGANSLRQIADVLNVRGIKTSRGGEWSAVQVMRILKAA